MKLDIDTEVRYPSGERVGFLRKVILDADNQVSVVVVETDNILSRKVIVPLQMLSEGPGEVTLLNADPTEVEALPTYEEERVPAADGWEFNYTPSAIGEVFPATAYEPVMPVTEVSNVPDDALSITQGTEIWCMDDQWGIVDDVFTGDQGKVQSILGRPLSVDEHKRLIPMELVSEAHDLRVVLNCSLADIGTYTEEYIDPNEAPEEE